MPTSVGYDVQSGSGYNYVGPDRGPGEFVLFQYTISGAGRLTFEGKPFHVRPGQAMILRMPHDHRYYLEDGDTWEFFWICISGREAVRIWSAILAAHGPLVEPGIAAVSRIADIVQELLRQPHEAASRSSALAYEVCMALAEDFLENGAAFRTRRRNDAVRAVIEYARENVDRPLSIDQMARMAGYSRSHFTRVFEQSEGTSPARFVLELRLRAALAQLQTGTKSVKEVAFDCGFRDPSYFAKTFRRVYGVAPSELSDGILASSLDTDAD
ncbi:helix-turn-helix domain-containing protein [Halovulum sp. GXIMD14794]